MSPRLILSTGSAGYIGSAVTGYLRSEGYRISGLDLRSGPEVDIVSDFRDMSVLDRVAGGSYSHVIHHAGKSDTRATDWAELNGSNVDGVLKLAQACRSGNARLIYASSFSVYGTVSPGPVSESSIYTHEASGPLNLYARSKLLLDERISELSPQPEYIGLRYTNVFGPDEWTEGRAASVVAIFVESAIRQSRIELFAGTDESRRDLVPVAVVCAAIRRLIEIPVPSGVYNLGTGSTISFGDLTQLIRTTLAPAPIEIGWVDNPMPQTYQHYTCADMTRLRACLPDLAVVSPSDLEVAIKEVVVARLRSERRDSGPVSKRP